MTPSDAYFVDVVCSDNAIGIAFYLCSSPWGQQIGGWRRRMAVAALDVVAEREEVVHVLGGGRPGRALGRLVAGVVPR